ncbi:hypothetical protein E4U55_002856 [Claviceps digitariae]|nr:hypothetical protein E4U55_002856 [Claviceps digitariae]
MDTPGTDAAVLDSKAQIAAGEGDHNGQKTELNGHSVDGASKSEPHPHSEAKSESLSRPAVTSEKPNDASLEPNKTVSEASAVTNDGNATDQQSPVSNGVGAAVKEETKPGSKSEDDAIPASDVTSATPPVPEAAEPTSGKSTESDQAFVVKNDDATKPSASEDTTMHDAPDVADDSTSKPGESEGIKVDRQVDEPSNKETVDTDMADSPSVKPKPSEEATTADIAEESSTASQDAVALPTSEVDLGSAGMSQLAIETTEKQSSPAEGSTDVPMTEAPGVKVARERDDDAAIDEPAPKRARTEPKDEEPTASAPAEGEAEAMTSGAESSGLNLSALTTLSNWADEETNKRPISAFQRREMRKIVGRIRKTKAGFHFRDSVQKLWPGLWDSYVAKVSRPMDLAELDRGLRDVTGLYNTYGDFRKDLGLIFENTLDFNGPLHDITASGATAVKAVWEEVLSIPSEEPAKSRAMPKPKPVRESRAIATTENVARRPSAVPPASPARVDAAATTKPSSSMAHEQAAADRRSSTATEGDRPKRTVRAPKPKDIDYTTKPSRKKLKPELQFAEEVLSEIMAARHHDMNQWFMDPVDAEGLNIPDYYSVIKKPMDLNKVSRMLSGGDISNLKEFEKTVRLIFDNCFKFNGPVSQGNPVSALAKKLEDLFLAQLKGKDAWLAKHAKSTNAPASASNASDEDEYDEDEDGEDAAAVAIDSKEIEELQAKLDEETRQLNSMLLTSNQSMIDIQKNIVDMVQKKLISKAQEAQAARAKAKSEKPKKSGKSGKAKSGASGGRKSIGGGQAKKSGGSKKVAPKKSLSAAQKDQIANGINDLEYPHLDRAIDIIKKDTGQNENNDGELELDIDQLSHDALGKLWDLCRKALPGFARDMEPISAPEASRPLAKPSSKASTAAKPKKNKPMSASEQEQRIAELQALSQMYKNPQEPGPGVTQAPTPGAESSDDSDSEEE